MVYDSQAPMAIESPVGVLKVTLTVVNITNY